MTVDQAARALDDARMPEDNLLVLVADDEASMLELVAGHLRELRDPTLDVIVAEDGEQALAMARARLPDLVVLDVMMPLMSGWEVCKRIREDITLAHTAVIMLTGIGPKVNELTSPLYSADAYIDKPFELADLDAKIRETLAARKSQRANIPHTNGTSGQAKPALAKAKAKPAKAAVKGAKIKSKPLTAKAKPAKAKAKPARAKAKHKKAKTKHKKAGRKPAKKTKKRASKRPAKRGKR
jgi:DNA-binding response OmpR family regulator